MITDAFMSIIGGAVSFIAGLFPSVSFNPVTYMSGALGVLQDVDYFFPMHELATLVVAFLQVGVPFALVQLSIWLIALLRGGNASA